MSHPKQLACVSPWSGQHLSAFDLIATHECGCHMWTGIQSLFITLLTNTTNGCSPEISLSPALLLSIGIWAIRFLSNFIFLALSRLRFEFAVTYLYYETLRKFRPTWKTPLLQYGQGFPSNSYVLIISFSPHFGQSDMGARESTLNSSPQFKQRYGESLPIHRARFSWSG